MIDAYRFEVRDRRGRAIGLTTTIGGAVLLALTGGKGSTITTQGDQLVWTCDRDGSDLFTIEQAELARVVWCQHLENRAQLSRKQESSK